MQVFALEVAVAVFFVLAPGPCSAAARGSLVAGAPHANAQKDHDRFDAEPRATAPQRYVQPSGPFAPRAGNLRDGRGRQLEWSPAAETCPEVHARGAVGPIRIGYELVDVENVEDDLVELVEQKLMKRAVNYWSATLQVHQAVEPLRVERRGEDCWKFPHDTEYHCTAVAAPRCGDIQIPEKFLKAKRTCTHRCAPGVSCSGACISGNTCGCDIDDWRSQGDGYCCEVWQPDSDPYCPAGCGDPGSLTFVGSGVDGHAICEGGCTDHPEGEGAAGEDVHFFVTIKDSASCDGDGPDTHAFASWCVKDQCDRPVFGYINFCKSQLSLEAEDLAGQVSTAVHEMSHVFVFTSTLFPYFRAADGSPLLPRDPADDDVFQDAVPWTCSAANSYAFPDPGGLRRYVDAAPAILNTFDERGFSSCGCPVGRATMDSTCLVPQTGVRTPSCVTRITTPRVVAEVRDFFDCPSLQGAELENQDTSGCEIVGSHWEQRVFHGEVMAPLRTSEAPFVSRVTLALFEDSGWYTVNYSMADPLTYGVHWGYKQGCAFAAQRCIDGGVPVARGFCMEQQQHACSMDRTHVRECLLESVVGLPAVFDYFGDGTAGSTAIMDYCPTYAVRLTNRICTSLDSITLPVPTVNFRREVFGEASRCLESTLHADVEADEGIYAARPSDFAEAEPVCYDVRCASDGGSYEVLVSDLEGGTQVLGTCATAGARLTSGEYGGEVVCAAPAELCQLREPLHDRWTAEIQHAPSPPAVATTSTPARASANPDGSPQDDADDEIVSSQATTSTDSPRGVAEEVDNLGDSQNSSASRGASSISWVRPSPSQPSRARGSPRLWPLCCFGLLTVSLMETICDLAEFFCSGRCVAPLS